MTLKAGEAFFIPAGTIHSGKKISSGDAAGLATSMESKGRPLVVLES